MEPHPVVPGGGWVQEVNTMEGLLIWKLQLGDVTGFYDWLKKQPTRQLLRMLPTTKVISTGTRPHTSFPHLFAVVKFLSEHGSGNVEEYFESIIATYVKAGCDLNAVCNDFPPSTRSRKGFTPLLLAIEQRKILVAKVLVKLGAKVNIPDEAGFSPLHWAALSTSSIELITCLLGAGAQIDEDGSSESTDGPRPVLHVAVDEGRVEIVDFLLGLGVDVNTSAVFAVLQEKHWEKLESRYDCGDLSCYLENVNITALGRAVRMRKLEVLSILLRHPEVRVSLSDLHFCILEGDTQTANMIIGKVNPALLADDRIIGTQIFSLHQLGKKGFDAEQTEETLKLVKTYISQGFDINSISQEIDNSSTPARNKFTSLLRLASSARTMNLRLIESFIHLGADPFLPIGKGMLSVYNISIEASYLDVVQICLRNPRLEVEKRLEFFDDVLSMTISNTEKKLNLVEFIKQSFIPYVQLKGEHLLKAIQGCNEHLVLCILQHLSEDEEFGSIFNSARALTFFKTEQEAINVEETEPHIPPGYLEDFLYRILNKNGLFFGIQISVDCVISIIRGFLKRGYQLPDKGCNSLAAVVVLASMSENFIRLPNSSAFFDELILLPRINWSPTLCSGESECPPLPLALILAMVATCTMPTTLNNTELTFSPLWIGDQVTSETDPALVPGCYRTPCHLVPTNVRRLEIFEKLLDKGVSAKGILLTNLLRRHKCLIRFFPLIKKLWWAGARVDFDRLSTFYDDESLLYYGGGDKDFVNDFRDWVGKGGKKANSSLQRTVVTKIRDSLKYQDIAGLANFGRAIPPKLLELIVNPQY